MTKNHPYYKIIIIKNTRRKHEKNNRNIQNRHEKSLEKKNPIAPIIVNKAIGTIENNLDQAFVNAIVYKVMDTAEDANVVAEGTATTTDVIIRYCISRLRKWYKQNNK